MCVCACLCMCVYLCVYLCARVCMCVSVCVWMCMCMYVSMCVPMYVCKCVCECACMHTCGRLTHPCLDMEKLEAVRCLSNLNFIVFPILNHWLSVSAKTASQKPQERLSLPQQKEGLLMFGSAPGFFFSMDSGDLNSGPYACTSST